MLLDIWMWLATIGLVIFILGIFSAQSFKKTLMLFLSLPFLLMTTLYAFHIEIIGFAAVTSPRPAYIVKSLYYPELGVFFGCLTIINIGLIVIFSLCSLKEECSSVAEN